MTGYWRDPLGTRRHRLLTFFLLYVSEGIPLGFTATVVATQMRREGLDPEVIGAYVGSLYLPWAFKWLLGPVVDTITWARFGRRRTWIVGAQLAMMLALLAAWPIDFTTSLALFTGVIFVHNVFAAAQDVAIDALAVQVLPEDERGTANGFMFAGQSIGQALGGSGMLLLTAFLPAGGTYLVVTAALAAILIGVSWRLREAPMRLGAESTGSTWRRVAGELGAFVRTTVRAFLASRAALLAVPFAALPLGAYALSLSLQSNLAVELGLADAEIGELGLWSSILSASGCVLGGWLSDRFGRRRMLALFVALTAGPALWLSGVLAEAGHVATIDPTAAAASADPTVVRMFWGACLLHSFVQGLTYGSSSALFMDVTTPAVAATQFTAYMALGNLVTSYTATWQGYSLAAWGYPATLALDALIGLACLLLLPWLRVDRASRRTDAVAL